MALTPNRGESQRGSTNRLPPAKRRRFRRLLINEHFHAVVWLLLTLGTIVLYVGGHSWLKCNYETSISAELDNAVKLYSVRPNALTRGLELTVGGTPYRPGTVDPGPLGIGKLPAAKGLLEDTSAALDRYNARLASTIGDILSEFRSSTAHPGYMVADLADVAPGVYRKEAGKQPDDPTADGEQPEEETADEKSASETTAADESSEKESGPEQEHPRARTGRQ